MEEIGSSDALPPTYQITWCQYSRPLTWKPSNPIEIVSEVIGIFGLTNNACRADKQHGHFLIKLSSFDFVLK
jgi:hypothetical protein